MTREALIRLLEERDPLAAARLAGASPAAPRAGAQQEATVPYGAGVPAEVTADRLLDLAARSRATGRPTVVVPTPAEGDGRRPGSWGVEDLTVIAAARAVLPAGVAVRPDRTRLDRGLLELATAFGAAP